MALRIAEVAVRSDTGRQRNANEDSYLTRAPLFVVADGMGGAQAGEVASKAAAESFAGELPQAPPERLLEETIEAANRTIHELARKDPELAGMGTTTTAAIVDLEAEEVAIGHVGDSRAYRLRGGKFEQLTRDHSLVEEMRRKGQLTDAQAEDHPQRSIITRALGPEPEVQVDVQTVPAQDGDVFLICSDGLTTMLDDEAIAREELDAKPRGGRWRSFAMVAAILLVVAAVAFGAWYANRQVWFLGTDDAGRVALYRGAPYELPFGIDLYSERYSIPVQTEALPARRQEAVTGHKLRSRDDAVSLIEDIEKSEGLR